MQCDTVMSMLDARIDGDLDAGSRTAFDAHLQTCEQCTDSLQNAERLQRNLAQLNAVRIPAERFEQITAGVIAAAADEQFRRQRMVAIAASLLIVVLTLWFSPVRHNRDTARDVVVMSLHTPGRVHLVLDAAHAMADAELTIQLPPDVELSGYPGRRVIQWQTNLKSGKNKLTLPVTAIVDLPGLTRLVASVRHNGKTKTYAIPIEFIDDARTPPSGGPGVS